MAQQNVLVTVNTGVSITVTPNTPVRVHRRVDTVRWSGSNEFGIRMPHSEPQPQCGWQGSQYVCVAGPFESDGTHKRTIKYDVTASGTPDLDPDIEIIPDSAG